MTKQTNESTPLRGEPELEYRQGHLDANGNPVKTGVKQSKPNVGIFSRDVDYSSASPEQLSEFYEDTNTLTKVQAQDMYDTISANVLVPQVNRQGKVFYNPEGLVTLADVLNMIGTANDKDHLNHDSVDGTSKSKDYFNVGYNLLLEKAPTLAGVFPRNSLFTPVTKKTTSQVLSIIYPAKKSNFKTSEDLLKRVELATIYAGIKNKEY